jgi:hypothetical protein
MGEIVTKQGNNGSSFHILVTGSITMSAMIHSQSVILCTKYTGDYFGDMALVEETQIEPVTIRAMEDNTSKKKK